LQLYSYLRLSDFICAYLRLLAGALPKVLRLTIHYISNYKRVFSQ